MRGARYRRAASVMPKLSLLMKSGGNLARGPLEISGHRPVALAAELRGNQVGNEWRNPAELCMAEGIFRGRRREELTVGSLDPFGDRDHAVAVPLQSLLDFGQKPIL